MRVQATLLAFAALLGCDSSGGDSEHEDEAPVLRSAHLGWKSTDCGSCHRLPVEDHRVTDPAACASCHGANGACDPNGDSSSRLHDAGDACVGCHDQQHGFTRAAECTGCHFADAGLDPNCGIDPPGGGELVSGCFGWPAVDFSPSNHAGVTLSVRTGETAVDFTLRDVGGTPHTLSDLLATKPVLMVLGSFT